MGSKYFNHPGAVAGYSPPRHRKTTNYRLAGKGVLEAKNMEIILGLLEKGGEAELHAHAESEQAIFILEGVMKAEIGEEIRELGPESLVYIPAGTPHRIVVISDQLRCLVLYSPPLKDW